MQKPDIDNSSVVVDITEETLESNFVVRILQPQVK
jgi:hypothetical protein